MPTETKQERTERNQAILLFRLQSFKDSFLPFRAKFETQLLGQTDAFNGYIPRCLDGKLAHIEKMITEQSEDIYSRGQYVRSVDMSSYTTSAWSARVVGRIKRLADRAATILGTTYTVTSMITQDGNFVEYRYILVPPMDNAEAERVQAALTETFGPGWPLLPADQLRLLNQKLVAANNSINVWTQAKISNPDNAEVFQRNIDKLEQERAEFADWIAYITSGVLPGDTEPQAVLETAPAEFAPDLVPDEIAPVETLAKRTTVLQDQEILEDNAISSEAFKQTAGLEDAADQFVRRTDPVQALETVIEPARTVEDVSTDKSLPDVKPTGSTAPGEVLGEPTGFIPDPSDPVDPSIIRGVTVRPPEFEYPGVDEFSDRMVDEFNSEFETFGGGFTLNEPNSDAEGPDTSADPTGSKKNLLIAAVVSAFLFKAF